MKLETIVVVAGGHPFGDVPMPASPRGDFVIAADGGIDRALALGLDVDLAIGDFDSVTAAGLAVTEAAGALVERHPAAKDATDLELALDAALARAPSRIVVLGSGGGRLDHLLALILLLGDPRYGGATIDADLDGSRLAVIRGSRSLIGAAGDLVSLIPVHGAAEGVTTSGLQYPLHDETLEAGTSRGISNVFVATEARVSVARGCLIAVQPGPEREGTL